MVKVTPPQIPPTEGGGGGFPSVLTVISKTLFIVDIILGIQIPCAQSWYTVLQIEQIYPLRALIHYVIHYLILSYSFIHLLHGKKRGPWSPLQFRSGLQGPIFEPLNITYDPLKQSQW